MRKFTFSFKTLLLLASMLIGGGNYVWADDVETVVVNQNFDDGSTTLFVAASRVTVSNDVNNVKFATPTNSTNGYTLATYDFSSVIGNDATAVKIEFDYYIHNGDASYYRYFTIGDKSLRTGFGKQSYVTTGGMFAFGLKRAKFNGSGSNTNFWSINNGSTDNTTANIIGAWAHVEVTINLSAKTSTYKFTSLDGKTEYYSGSGLAYMDGTASNCNQIDFFDCANSVNSYLDNLKITKYWDCQASYTLAKAEYDTKVASLDAAGQAYWAANVTSAASVTNEASYNTAVASLPTTYIAAVKAQTTPGCDMTDAMKTEVSTTSWTNATGTYAGVAAERYAGNDNHFSTGNILYQTISGLHAGYYRVKFYGVANRARNIAEEYYGEGIAQMFANSQTLDVDVINQADCSPITDAYLRTFEVYLSEDNSSIEFGIKNIKEGGQWYVAQALSLTYLGSELYDYTINYKFNDAIISSTEGSTFYGETVNATSPITISDTKYFATSATSMVIGEEPNVLNVTLREAETWSYTVRAVNSTAGVLDDNLVSGSVTEGESAPKFFFPRFILKGTTLYCSKTGATNYSDVITPNADDYIYDINYNLTPVNDVVFYTEGEDVTGVSQGANADRASMGKMGYTGGADTYKDVTTLDPGKYVLYSRFQNGSGSNNYTFNFKVGEGVVHTGTQSKGTNGDTNSAEFTVETLSTLSFASGGQTVAGVDYFYIVKTGNVFTPQSSANLDGWKTFYNADANYEVDANTTIYIATTPASSATNVVLTPVLGKVIPANTPVILKTDAVDWKMVIAQTSEEPTDASEFDDNGLQVATAGVIDGACILAYTTADGLGFYPFSGSLDAGDVYIKVSGSAKKFSLVVGGEASEVVAPEVAETEEEDEVLYNMAGIQVDKNFKGFVINQKGVKRFNK